MKINLVFVFIISSLLFSIPAFAQTIGAGVTPDNFLYSLDTALDQIRLLLTFDNTAKARISLEIAQERLQEVREMILQNKFDAAQTAQKEQSNALTSAENAVRTITRINSTQEAEDVVKIERELEEHETEVENVANELKVKIEIKGGITTAQKELVNSMLDKLGNRTGEVKIKIDNKKDEIKSRIKQQINRTDEEIDNEIRKIEIRERVFEIKSNKALERIEDANEKIQEVKTKLTSANVTENVTVINKLLQQAEDHLARAETAFNETKFGEAFGQATSAEGLASNAERLLERLLKIEEKLRVEAELEDRQTKVKVKVNETETKFTLNTTNREEIISAIIEKTGLSREQVKKALKIEVEKPKEKIVERLTKEREKIKERIEKEEVKIEKVSEKEVRTTEANKSKQKSKD